MIRYCCASIQRVFLSLQIQRDQDTVISAVHSVEMNDFKMIDIEDRSPEAIRL